MHQDGPIGKSIAATIFLVILIGYLTLTLILNPDVHGTDKSHHLLAYAALVFPLSFSRPRISPFVALPAAAYGGAVEVIQPLTEKNRELLDSHAGIGAEFGWSRSGGASYTPRLVEISLS